MASKEADGDTTRRQPFHFSPKFPVIDGVRFFPGTTRELLQTIKNLPVKGDEVFVATYPRSGTTWACEIVWQVFFDGSTDQRPIRKRVPLVEVLNPFSVLSSTEALVDFFSAKPFPRVFKTHLPYPLVPMGDGVTTPKYINVIRNPKDCAVSRYHQARNIAFVDFDGPWEEYFEMFMQSEGTLSLTNEGCDGRFPSNHLFAFNFDDTVSFGSWFDHVLGWWAHRDDPNILILKYEDMKKDLPFAVKQIAQFLDKELSNETIQLIAKQTSFNAMAAGDGRFFDGDESHELFKRRDVNNQWIRKGEVGEWKNYFTEEQNRRFDEVYEKKMAGSGLELEFD